MVEEVKARMDNEHGYDHQGCKNRDRFSKLGLGHFRQLLIVCGICFAASLAIFAVELIATVKIRKAVVNLARKCRRIGQKEEPIRANPGGQHQARVIAVDAAGGQDHAKDE